MSDIQQRIADNVSRLRERIARAAERSGRTTDKVAMVAVTKYVQLPEVRALVQAGCHELGESRPQELWHKAEEVQDPDIQWHLVGHLQRNKIRRTLSLVSLIHSIDSQRLLEALDREAAEQQRIAEILLEVNVSAEEAKHGFAPDELGGVLETLPGLSHLRVRGLMCMARLEEGPSAARGDFAPLRELRDQWRGRLKEGVSLDELSMGMSGDFEAAIEEGATIVRIGTMLFEGVL